MNESKQQYAKRKYNKFGKIIEEICAGEMTKTNK